MKCTVLVTTIYNGVADRHKSFPNFLFTYLAGRIEVQPSIYLLEDLGALLTNSLLGIINLCNVNNRLSPLALNIHSGANLNHGGESNLLTQNRKENNGLGNSWVDMLLMRQCCCNHKGYSSVKLCLCRWEAVPAFGSSGGFLLHILSSHLHSV